MTTSLVKYFNFTIDYKAEIKDDTVKKTIGYYQKDNLM